MYLHDLK